ncbi:MAG: alpha/beta hydrolase family protein [Oscillospiraceae bacterium]
MALAKMNFFSKALMRTVSIQAIIPTDKMSFGTETLSVPEKFKTLYLLHGIFGNDTDWVTGTRIQSWAQDKNLVVIMPSGENKFYVDNPKSGDNFGTFIGKELVDFTRKTFPLSAEREDTFIGGLSMGGYGALCNGLKYSETFGGIVALSSGLILDAVMNSEYEEEWSTHNRYYYESIFGSIDQIKGSDKDYFALIKKLIDEKRKIPDIYMACGTEDFLYHENVEYHEFLRALKVKHTFEKGPGIHDWIFWDTYIKKALEWLPLDETSKGISSGNVR